MRGDTERATALLNLGYDERQCCLGDDSSSRYESKGKFLLYPACIPSPMSAVAAGTGSEVLYMPSAEEPSAGISAEILSINNDAPRFVNLTRHRSLSLTQL